jgi:hypothetical protein
MSQSVPLSKLLPRYNAVVESFQKRMQRDNVKHLDNMLSLYTYGLQGGCSSRGLSYLEKKLAARDDYNNYRSDKDAMEWMKVDQKLHSYLGRNMNVLSGGGEGDEDVPSTKEPQMVQSLKLLSAFINNLAKKMMSSRSAALEELIGAVNVMMIDPEVPENVKGFLQALHDEAVAKFEEKLDRDAKDLVVLEEYTVRALAPNTSRIIMRSGIARSLPEASGKSVAPQKQEESEEEKSEEKVQLGGGGGCGVPSSMSEAAPKFRSSAAQHLYNVISQ